MRRSRGSRMKRDENVMSIVSQALEIMDMQADIMDYQRKVLDEVFCLLGQHIAAEELDALECIKELNKAAALRECVQRRREEAGFAP